MLPYMTATNDFFFPVVIDTSTVLSQTVNQGQQAHTASNTPINITLDYPAASTKEIIF